MGYSILDSETHEPLPIRLIADRQPARANWLMFQVCDSVVPQEWSCEPLNLPDRRYRIVWSRGGEEYRPWYEVIAPDDDAHDVNVKLAQCANVKTARMNYEAACEEYTRIAGRSPEILHI